MERTTEIPPGGTSRAQGSWTVFAYHRDISIPTLGLWLDPGRAKRFAFVSHAHGDHVARHDRMLATPATFAFCEQRTRAPAHGIRCAIGEALELRDAVVRLHPAGHIVGSAQISIERKGERLVYTGDFNLRGDGWAGKGEIVKCQTLIMECTYGDPAIQFPPRQQALLDLRQCLRELLAGDKIPVVLAHLLARAPELVQHLSQHGFQVAVPPTVRAVLDTYRALGVDVGVCEDLRVDRLAGRVIVVPPYMTDSKLVRGLQNVVRVAVTGYAVLGAGHVPYRADHGFAVSDHADFADLVAYVRDAAPENVYLTHGPIAFRDHLRDLGYRAHTVEERITC